MLPALILYIVIMFVVMAVIFVLAFAWLRRLARTRKEAVQARFPDAKMIINGANFFGQQSHGVTQTRGNGTLVLTDSEIFFEKWVPRREYRIPLSAIQGIETPTSFLGKTQFTPLLKVVYTDEAGQTDSIAWRVVDLDGAIRAIQEQQRKLSAPVPQ